MRNVGLEDKVKVILFVMVIKDMAVEVNNCCLTNYSLQCLVQTQERRILVVYNSRKLALKGIEFIQISNIWFVSKRYRTLEKYCLNCYKLLI